MSSVHLREPVAKGVAGGNSAEPIRLLYVRDTLIVCGPGKTILSSWRAIDRNKFELTIASTRPKTGLRNALLDTARRLGAHAIDLTIGRGIDLIAAWRLIRLVRQHRIDILQTHDAPTRRIGVLVAAVTGVLHFTSVHGWIFNDARGHAVRWFDARFIRWADIVITVSDRLRQEIEQAGVPASKITVLRNAVLLDDYVPGASASAREALGLRADHAVVAIVGRLSPEKGHDDFLKAARVIVDEIPDARFLIVGDGPLAGALKNRVTDLGLTSHVIFTGHRTDLSVIYAATDVLVLSSYTEGVPNVLLEAFAFGKPAVATTVGGVPEVMRDGVDGWLVRPGDCEGIAHRVLQLLKDSVCRQQMGASARLSVEDRFDFQKRMRALENMYVEALVRRAAKHS